MSDTVQMPAEVAAIFAAQPTAGLVLVEMGHAYGKAKFSSTCKLTGIALSIGAPYRRLAFWTRSGRYFDGFVPTKTAERLEFRGATFAESFSTWTRWTPEDWATATADLASLPVGTRIEVMRDARGSWDVVVSSWFRQEFDGKWRNVGTRGESTDGQLAAALKRTTGAAFFRILPPR